MASAKAGGRAGGGRRSALVSPREAGLRLDRFLVGAFPGISRKRAKRLVDGRKVSVDGRIESMASRVLRGGERVEAQLHLDPPRSRVGSVVAVYEDDQCLAILKPPGLPSGPTRDPERAHAARLAAELAGQPLILLHRIDKDTSGLLLLAKTRDFAQALTAAFKRRAVEKTYLALVRGDPPHEFQAVSHLREGEGGRMRTVRSGGARAETRFRTLASREGYALLEARPRTGRTHQIRVQLARSGYPILGDSLYGGDALAAGRQIPRHMLHAWSLVFPHPGLGHGLRIEAPVPGDFLELAQALLGRRLPPALGSPERPRSPGGHRTDERSRSASS